MNVMMQPVLVLNASYEPVNICGAKRALILVIKGAALVEESREMRAHRDFMVPSVVRLRQYHRVPNRVQVLSRKNIYLRDNYTCQYCGEKLTAKQLTLDHVIPRAQHGTSRWENLVACCEPCNRRKNDRTPEQAGMKLLRVPRPLTIHTSRGMIRLAGHEEQAWRKYLYF
jgi:5-methylcytosine-specific restriction endonuclease McrA